MSSGDMVETGITAAGMNDSTNEGGEKKGWFGRLAGGLKRSSSQLGSALVDLVTKGPMDPAKLDMIQDALVRADLGYDLAHRVTKVISEGAYSQGITPDEVKAVVAAEVAKILRPVAKPLVIERRQAVRHPGGRRQRLRQDHDDRQACLEASRPKAARWCSPPATPSAPPPSTSSRSGAQRTGAKVVAREPGADSAGLAFDALNVAKAEGADVLIVDTAGRLQNRTELMSELEKMLRVMKKLDPAAPHAVLLVLDATVGQNALSQVEVFGKIAGVTGLVMTKLDGTARGGILVSIAEKFKLPIHFIGVGEGVDDLAPFAAQDFGRALAGLE